MSGMKNRALKTKLAASATKKNKSDGLYMASRLRVKSRRT